QLAGEEVALTLRSGEVNDVLKSLLVGDRRGGRVLGVRYETPTDRQARLAAVPLALSPDHSLLDLLRALRGQEVRLVVGEGGPALCVSCVVPSPAWRVAYRLVAESAPASTRQSDATAAVVRDGELVLQGWGLFDNTWEEDLDEVDVTLVAGQPISFIYDIAASRVPQRPMVHDVARVAAAPVEFEGVVEEGAVSPAAGSAAPRSVPLDAAYM